MQGARDHPLTTGEHEQPFRDRRILDSLREGVLMFGADGRILTANTAVEHLFEVPTVYLTGRTHEEIVAGLERLGGRIEDEDGMPFPLEDHPVVLARQTGEPVANVLVGIRRSDDRPPEWYQVSARPLTRRSSGPPFPVVVSFSEVTEIRRAELERDELVTALASERRFLGAALASIADGVMACDAELRVTVFNEAMRLYLRPVSDPIGKPPSVSGLEHPDGRRLAPEEHPLGLALAGSRVVDLELVAAPVGGERRCLLVNGRQLVARPGEVLGAVVAFHDVTDQKRIESELTNLALHDPLTGLANRILLTDRLEVAFERGTREDTGVGVILLDLDDFKQVNDTYGHGVGDGVLVCVGARLRAVVRPGDTVARLGGDEFVVVCPLAGGEAELARVADRLSRALAMPMMVGEHELQVTASIGLSVGGPGKGDPETLLRGADEAMYQAKNRRMHARGEEEVPPAG